MRPAVWLWAAFLGSHAGYILIRSFADPLLPVLTGYAAAADRFLFAGRLPVVWLQTHLYAGASPAWWQWYFVITYASFFAAPIILAGALHVTRARTFPVFMIAMAIAHAIALVGHVLLPTAPPWLLGLDASFPDAHRIVHELLFGSNMYTTGLRLSANDVAAMPSLHIAATAVVAFTVMGMGRLGVACGVVYITSMTFAVIYLGEHFLVDVVAGLLTGAIAWRLASSIWARRCATRELRTSRS